MNSNDSLARSHPTTDTRAALRGAIARQRDGLLDWEIVIEDTRREMARLVTVLRDAVTARDRETARLRDLLARHDAIERVA